MSDTKGRHIRIDDRLWNAVQDKARFDQTTVSQVVRELLERWLYDAPGGEDRIESNLDAMDASYWQGWINGQVGLPK